MVKKIVLFLNLLFLSIGAIVGAGFVSGAEVWTFFARFGINSVLSILMIFVLFFVFLQKIINKNFNAKMLNNLKNSNKNTFLVKNKIKSYIINFNIFVISSAMFSGLRTIIYKLFKNNYLFIFLLVLIFVFVVLILGISFLSKLNFLIEILVLIEIFIVALNLKFDHNIFNFLSETMSFCLKNQIHAMWFAIVYFFMNIVQIEPIFFVCDVNFNKKESILFSFILSFVLCLFLFVLSLNLNLNLNIASRDMPMFDYFGAKGNAYLLFFSVVVFGGLFSTLLICLSSIKTSLNKHVKSEVWSSFLACFACLVFGSLPFSFFVNVMYIFVGILNFINYIFL